MSYKGSPINHFVRRMQLIDNLQVQNKYEEMFEWLLVTHENFNNQDQEQDIAETLENHIRQINKINGRTYNHTLKLRAKEGAKLFHNGGHELKKRIYKIMWKGYINKESFKPILERDDINLGS